METLRFFMGNSEHNLDDKGRVIVPSKFRDLVDPEADGEGFIVVEGPEGCLFLYTPLEWMKLCRQFSKLPQGSPELRSFQRKWHGNAEHLTLDKQGRVQVPKRLRDHAGLEKEAVLAGCFDRIELWSKPRWDKAQNSAESTYGAQMQAFLSGEASEETSEE
ncbi:MAG: division/cell wall cluster transcriptional repressor MraZ [Planctomycetota bacterium]